MDGHLLNNFALHNELPISTRSKVVDVEYEKSGKKKSDSTPKSNYKTLAPLRGAPG